MLSRTLKAGDKIEVGAVTLYVKSYGASAIRLIIDAPEDVPIVLSPKDRTSQSVIQPGEAV